MSLVEELEEKITAEMEHKHFHEFEKCARYVGNGFYHIPSKKLYSTNTRELFLMFVAREEGIYFTAK